MTAIAFDIPVEIERITAGLERFVRAEVITRHEKHQELLEDPRRRYGPDPLNPFQPGVSAIWLGNVPKNYDAHIVGVTLAYKFE